jgi:hypothetical protein
MVEYGRPNHQVAQLVKGPRNVRWWNMVVSAVSYDGSYPRVTPLIHPRSALWRVSARDIMKYDLKSRPGFWPRTKVPHLDDRPACPETSWLMCAESVKRIRHRQRRGDHGGGSWMDHCAEQMTICPSTACHPTSSYLPLNSLSLPSPPRTTRLRK